MVWGDLEKKKAYFREYYHKTRGKGKTYKPRACGVECECGARVAENRLESHTAGLYHIRMMKRKERQAEKEKKLQEQENKN